MLRTAHEDGSNSTLGYYSFAFSNLAFCLSEDTLIVSVGVIKVEMNGTNHS